MKATTRNVNKALVGAGLNRIRMKQWLLRKLPEPISWRLYLWLGWEIVSTPQEERNILEAVRRSAR